MKSAFEEGSVMTMATRCDRFGAIYPISNDHSYALSQGITLSPGVDVLPFYQLMHHLPCLVYHFFSCL